jgi:hypothetical protein
VVNMAGFEDSDDDGEHKVSSSFPPCFILSSCPLPVGADTSLDTY